VCGSDEPLLATGFSSSLSLSLSSFFSAKSRHGVASPASASAPRATCSGASSSSLSGPSSSSSSSSAMVTPPCT
jgi:hypothetical protein